MIRWILATALALTALPATASAQYIGIFMDPSSANCAATVGAQPWIDLYVAFINEGSSEMIGAQFSIVGAPDTWNAQNVLWVPDTGVTISIGHPLFANAVYENSGGTALAMPPCRSGAGWERIPLGRLVILGAPTPENVHLQVAGAPLTPREQDCPVGFLCDEPTFSQYCVRGGEAFLNGDNATQSCQVGVEESTWTAIRVLYR